MLKKIQFFLPFSFCYNTIWIAVLGFGVTGDFGVGVRVNDFTEYFLAINSPIV